MHRFARAAITLPMTSRKAGRYGPFLLRSRKAYLGLGAFVAVYIWWLHFVSRDRYGGQLFSNTPDQPLYERKEDVFREEHFHAMQRRLATSPILTSGTYLDNANFGATHGIVIMMNTEGLPHFYQHPLLRDMVRQQLAAALSADACWQWCCFVQVIQVWPHEFIYEICDPAT